MKKVRDTKTPLLLADAQKAISDFRNDFANQYELFSITDSLIQRAMGLPEKHKLRAYDEMRWSIPRRQNFADGCAPDLHASFFPFNQPAAPQ
jgi:hypothetical protein